MRTALVLAALLVSGPAFAGSIDVMKSLPKGAAVESIERIGCTTCPPPQPKKSAYSVVTLKPGEQKLELRTVLGKQKLYRTEAWLGGSPVVFVSTPTEREIADMSPKAPAGDGIDGAVKTSALPEEHAPLASKPPVAAAMGAQPAAPAPLDMSGFTLRTN